MKFIFQRENIERRQKLKKLTSGLTNITDFDKLLDELEQGNFDTGMYIIKRQIAEKMEELGIRLNETINKKGKLPNMNKLPIKIPYSFQDPDRFQFGWNECIKQIKELNPSLDYEEVCLMDYEKCGCEDCEEENEVMDR